MSKRKRDGKDEGSRPGKEIPPSKTASRTSETSKKLAQGQQTSETIQIITGSYDRVLHGFTATIDLSDSQLKEQDKQPEVAFADSFLFAAHSSAIHCLALSPLISEANGVPAKVTLASGGSDERVNLYTLSGNAPIQSSTKVAAAPTLSSIAREENPKNREIGSLMHHSSTITQLCFATRSKLLSSSEDNTIAVSRTRDWTALTTFKAPMPNVIGRPSGDTAPPGGAPAGVNDFSIHPSMKIMISVGKGERSMRLWNLVTGKKAGALDFDRDLLQAVGESKWASAEARSILFSPNEEEFVVSFDRGAAIFSVHECKIQGLVLPNPRTKLHKMRFLPGSQANVLAISTDDGRVLFFNTQSFDSPVNKDKTASFKQARMIAQLGGPTAGVAVRVKSFQLIESARKIGALFVVTCCSDGSTRVWLLESGALGLTEKGENGSNDENQVADVVTSEETKVKQVGTLLGRFDTANRIVCMEAFKMLPPLDMDQKDPTDSTKATKKSSKQRAPNEAGGLKDSNGVKQQISVDEGEFAGFD